MTDAVERKLGDLEGRIQRVDDALGRGATSISEMSAGMSDATRMALEQALETISDEAARAAEEARHQSHAHMEPLLAGLHDLVASIRQTADEGREHLASGGRAAADTLVSAASALSDRLASASSEASANLAGAAASMRERMDATVDQFRNIERAVAAHVEHLRRAGETINSAGNSFGAASERLRQAAEPVATTLVSVEVSARHATEALRVATAANDSMREATARLSEASRSASEVFNSYQSRFEGTDRALGTTIRGLVDGSVQLSNCFSEVVAEMDNHLSEAIGKLRMGIEDIRSMVTDLSESATEIRQAAMDARVAAE
jgi:chromosome segregation ATPase